MRSCESGVIFTTAACLLIVSFSVTVPAARSTDVISPARLRKVPETISSAVNSVPSAFLLPRARNWSPILIWLSGASLASSNFTELGA